MGARGEGAAGWKGSAREGGEGSARVCTRTAGSGHRGATALSRKGPVGTVESLLLSENLGAAGSGPWRRTRLGGKLEVSEAGS